MRDYLFFFHDDLFIKNKNIIADIVSNKVDTYYRKVNDNIEKIKNDKWLHIANGFDNNHFNPRGSFAVFKKALLKNMKHFLIFNIVELTRENKVNSPNPNDLKAISGWNLVTQIFSKYIEENNLQSRCYRLTPDYRSSKYIIECERGFIKT